MALSVTRWVKRSTSSATLRRAREAVWFTTPVSPKKYGSNPRSEFSMKVFFFAIQLTSVSTCRLKPSTRSGKSFITFE